MVKNNLSESDFKILKRYLYIRYLKSNWMDQCYFLHAELDWKKLVSMGSIMLSANQIAELLN